MKILECEQYSDEWWSTRRGLPTASKFDKLITPTGKPSTQSKGYMYELIADIVAPDEIQTEPTEWMIRGLELEGEARDWLAMKRGSEIREVGLCIDDSGDFAASPDGLLDEEIPLEIKCPKASTHVGYLLNNELPSTYAAQVHGQMIVTGAKKALFLSYHPNLQPMLIEVKRSDYTKLLANAVKKFVRSYHLARDKVLS